MAPSPSVFITGATGAQGGGLARRARQLGWDVHAIARDLNSPNAIALTSIGVKLTQGDWDNSEALAESIAGCQFLFLNLYPDFTDWSHELKQAQNIFKIAKAARVKHAIYTGAVKTEKPVEGMAGEAMRSKLDIEQALRETEFETWTILRPGFFMTNFLSPGVHMYEDAYKTGLFVLAFRPETKLAMIDPPDIAKWAIAAFEDPQKFHGKILSFAGDLVPIHTAIDLLAQASGRDIRLRLRSDTEVEENKATNPWISSQLAVRDLATAVDMDEIKSYGIPMTSFEEFVAREKEALGQTYGEVPRLGN